MNEIKPIINQSRCLVLEKEVKKMIMNGTLPDLEYEYFNTNNINYTSKGMYKLLIKDNQNEHFEILLDHKFNLYFFIKKIWHVTNKKIDDQYTKESIHKQNELKELYNFIMKKGGENNVRD